MAVIHNTAVLGLRLRGVGSILPPKYLNTWVGALNLELVCIDAAIGEVCTPEQVEQIKAKLSQTSEGIIL